MFEFDGISIKISHPNVTMPHVIEFVASLTIAAVVDVFQQSADLHRFSFAEVVEINGGRARFARIVFVRFFHFIVL